MIRKTMTIYKLAVDDTPVTEDFAKKKSGNCTERGSRNVSTGQMVRDE
jgi:hypothetical protein